MENFEGLPHSAKPTQTLERAPEMKLILQRVRPIEGVFNPAEEAEKLWLVPKEQRGEAVSAFEEKLARQREAWALCRTSIEKRIESNPDLPREKMVGIVREFASHYGFAESHVEVAESLVDDFLEMRRRVNETRKKYPNNINLIHRLTGMKFTESDAEDFTVAVGPMSIEIFCSGFNSDFNARRIYEKSKVPVVGFRYGGFASMSRDLKPVYYIVVNNEREHQKNKILAPELYGKGEISTDVRESLNRGVLEFLRHQVGEKLFDFERKFEDEVFKKYPLPINPEEKKFLRKLESLRDGWNNEIPEKEIHGYQNPGKNKFLKTWFTLVASDLQLAVSKGEITDPETIEKVRGFVEKLTSKDFHNQQLIKLEDIKEADGIINLVTGKS